MTKEFNPTDVSKHIRAKHIASLVLGQKEPFSDEDEALKARHTELLTEKEVDLKDEHEVLVSVYITLGGGQADLGETSADTTETAKPKRPRAKKKAEALAPTADAGAETGAAPTV